MKVAAIVLAAGGSIRLGVSKQLLIFRGRTLVRRMVEAAIDAGCEPVAVVVGREGKEIAESLQGLAARIVPNERWEDGIGSSLRAGINVLTDWEVVVIVTCDQPHVDSTLIRSLISAQAKTQRPIVASAYVRTLGVPALFTRRFREELLSLPNEHGAKAIIAAHGHEVASVDFPQGAIDIDTPADYRALQASP